MLRIGITLTLIFFAAGACSAQPHDQTIDSLLTGQNSVSIQLPLSLESCESAESIPIKVKALEVDSSSPVRFGVFSETDPVQPMDEFAFFPPPDPGDQEVFFVQNPGCSPGASKRNSLVTLRLLDQIGEPFMGDAEFEVELGQ